MDFFKKLINFFSKKGEFLIVLGLIIVLLIIGYSYFSFGTKNSRDTLRYANLLSIGDNLNLFLASNNTLPLPQNPVSLISSGKILTYQGYFGETLSNNLIKKVIKDPLDSKYFDYLNYYTYTTSEDKQNFQLMAFYENNTSKTYIPNIDRLPFLYGNEVGIAFDSLSKRPIQETKINVDISKTLNSYNIYINNNSIISGDNLELKKFLVKGDESIAKSCLNIKEIGFNKSGYYYINPLLNTAFSKFTKLLKVFCDLENDGGGWTRLYYKTKSNSCENDNNYYFEKIISKVFTKDFAVSDNLESLKSEGSWILKNIDLKNKDFSLSKLTNVANCKTPNGEKWSSDYGKDFKFFHKDIFGNTITKLEDNSGILRFNGTLSTLGKWDKMYYGCDYYKNIGDNTTFEIGGFEGHEQRFIYGACSNFSLKDNSISSKWDTNNTRVFWVR
ncbi:hypothetical protein H3C61_03730 [Candidatus Gracilibacteria bacterium]|nr:hypothetical protein [Candidatus Gracilibacteria bacterium]